MNLRRTTAALLIAVLGPACSTSPAPQDPMEQLFPEPPRPEYRVLGSGTEALAYVEMQGTPGGEPILFIHGSPGDWKAWQRFLVDPALKDFGDRISVDRPGFGGSAASGTITSMAEQARRIGALIDPAHPPLVVGHSLGGPIALRLAIDAPEKVRGVLLVAGSISPEREGVRWYNHLASALAWVLPQEWERSNEEMFTLQPELRLLTADLPGLRCPVLALQGMKDTIVEPESAADFQTRVPSARVRVVRYPKLNHFLLWTHPELVEGALKDLDAWARADAGPGAAGTIPPTAAALSPG